ncbi:hypothetical protein A6C57_27880 (plasmid) [Fibrella sp. ES10-3-2-2]
MTESEEIDALLKVIKSGGYYNGKTEGPERTAAFKALAFGLINEPDNPRKYTLTGKGYECMQQGGFDKWLAEKNKQEEDARKAITDGASAAKTSAFSAAASAILTLVTIYFSVRQCQGVEIQKSQIDSLKNQINMLKSGKPISASQVSL